MGGVASSVVDDQVEKGKGGVNKGLDNMSGKKSSGDTDDYLDQAQRDMNTMVDWVKDNTNLGIGDYQREAAREKNLKNQEGYKEKYQNRKKKSSSTREPLEFPSDFKTNIPIARGTSSGNEFNEIFKCGPSVSASSSNSGPQTKGPAPISPEERKRYEKMKTKYGH